MQPTTNGQPASFSDQANQDWGHHEFLFGLTGHEGDWRTAQTDWQAYRLNDPLIAFSTGKHPGSLGKRFSLLHLNNPRIRVLALKKAENSDEIIIRMVELDGKAAPDVSVSFSGPVVAAREVNGQEQPVGPATIRDSALATSFTPYQPRTFAVRLGSSATRLAAIQSQPVTLQYDLAVATNDDTKTPSGGFDGHGNAMPAEMLPGHINYRGIEFNLAPAKTGSPNAIVAKGQTIRLPAGRFNRIYILAASVDGDQTASFHVGERVVALNIQDWSGFIGQWDTRVWKDLPQTNWAISANHAVWPPSDIAQREKPDPTPSYPQDYVGLKAGFVKPAGLAWYASHHHTADGLNEPYQYSYLFAYSMDLNPNEKTLVLPDNSKIRILAVSVAQENPELKPAQPLFDTLNRADALYRREFHRDPRFGWPSSGAASGRILALPARDHCNHQREQYPHSPGRLAFCQHSASGQPERSTLRGLPAARRHHGLGASSSASSGFCQRCLLGGMATIRHKMGHLVLRAVRLRQ
jgi:alpha-mannosidase